MGLVDLIFTTDSVQYVKLILVDVSLKGQHTGLDHFLLHWRGFHFFVSLNNASIVLLNFLKLLLFFLDPLLKL